MPKLRLIFVHVPKTGGTAVKNALAAHFGDALYGDYADGLSNPVSQINLDPDGFLARNNNSDFSFLAGKQAVIGHLWIHKYDAVPVDLCATVLRHPIDRAISHFFFWKMATLSNNNPLRDYVVKHELGIVEFCRLPMMRYFYTRYYFRDTDMSRFGVICDHGELMHNPRALMGPLGIELMPDRINETLSIMPDYADRRRAILDDPALKRQLSEILSDDIRLYETALSTRHN